MMEQTFILAQNERVVPTVAVMLEALDFSKAACISNVFEGIQTQYHINSWEDICERPITFWCNNDRLLIVLDEQKEQDELPLSVRVLIAYGEIFQKRIKIIVSDGCFFKRKKNAFIGKMLTFRIT